MKILNWKTVALFLLAVNIEEAARHAYWMPIFVAAGILAACFFITYLAGPVEGDEVLLRLTRMAPAKVASRKAKREKLRKTPRGKIGRMTRSVSDWLFRNDD